MSPSRPFLVAAVVALATLPRPSAAEEASSSKRGVLVELYTSQGCDMCPAAEEILGRLAAENPGIIPIAFHVDYFNKPWKDVFSDPMYSQRQMVYNEVYTGPRHEKYGLYFTPMLMIDGALAVNGRDPAGAAAAIRTARARPPAVSLKVDLELAADGLSGKASATVSRRSKKLGDAPLLVCAVLREDRVSTDVQSGENAGKTLIARFPARRTEFDFIDLKGTDPASKQFPFTIDPTWNRDKLRLACFVQDKRTAVVYQAVDIPWQAPRAN